MIFDLLTMFVAMVTELASLTPAQLMEKIRALQNMAYQLGVEEGMFVTMVILLPYYLMSVIIIIVLWLSNTST